jgi:hypothetical protein
MERQYVMIDEAIERLLNFREGGEPTTLSQTREAHRRFQLAPADFDHFRDVFIEALKEMGERDPEVLDSWRAVLRPGLDYMKQCASKSTSPKRPAAKSTSPNLHGRHHARLRAQPRRRARGRERRPTRSD